MKNILVAATTGCFILFIWGALSHLVLFVGSGFKSLPNEDSAISVFKKNIPQKGLYLFPGKDFKHSTAQEDKAFEEKFSTGPVGMLVYRPVGGNPFSPSKLVVQFICSFLTALLLAYVVSLTAISYWKRVFLVILLGCLPCVSVSSIYWNWYEFPDEFFVAQCADQIIGCFFAGLAIAKIVRRTVVVQGRP